MQSPLQGACRYDRADAREARHERLQFLSDALREFPLFCGLLQLIPKEGVKQRFVLNEIQQRYHAARTARDIILKARQVGFTTFELARDLWYFLNVPGARVVAICQSATGDAPKRLLSFTTQIFLRSLQELGLELNIRAGSYEWVLPDRDARFVILEAGASQASAQKKWRGGTISRLHMTELAIYEYAQDTLNAVIECVPAQAPGNEIVIESTPNGAAGTYFEQYQAAKQGISSYKAHFFPWFLQSEYRTALAPGEVILPETEQEHLLLEQHGVSPEQLKWYRQKVRDTSGGQRKIDQEYASDDETCFLVAGRQFFDRTVTIALRGKTVQPMRLEMGGALKIFAPPEPGKIYTIGADPSEGTGGDPGVAVVYERATGEHVASLAGQFPPGLFADKLAALGQMYNTALLVVERNNHGHAVLQALEKPSAESGRLRYPKIYRAKDKKLGWYSTEVSRSAALDALEDAHRKGEWSTPDVAVLGEMLTFVVNKHGKAEAAKGAHDDHVLATAIAWDVSSKPLPPQQEAVVSYAPSFEERTFGD